MFGVFWLTAVLVWDGKEFLATKVAAYNELKNAIDFSAHDDVLPTIDLLHAKATSQLRESISHAQSEAEKRANQLQDAAVTAIDNEVQSTEKAVSDLKQQLKALDSKADSITLTLADAVDPKAAIEREIKRRIDHSIEAAQLNVELDVRQQQLLYLKGIRTHAQARESCNAITKTCAAQWASLGPRVRDYRALYASVGVLQRRANNSPTTMTKLDRAALARDRDKLAKLAPTIKRDSNQYLVCVKARDQASQTLNSLGHVRDFAIDQARAVQVTAKFSATADQLKSEVAQELERWRSQLEGARDNQWVAKHVYRPADIVFWPVVLAFAGWLFGPIILKLISFYVLAPRAASQKPLCLDPAAGGLERIAAPTAVSISIDLDTQSELVLHPQYLQTTPDDCSTDPRMILNRKCIRACLHAGLYGLTQVRTSGEAAVSISSGRESLIELAIIDVPAGSAFSVIPLHLVGVVQNLDAPVRLTRERRFGSIQAWLRLRWRYLVLHGPAQVVIKGCRGIRVKDSRGGRKLDDATIIGFSANLHLSTSRAGDPLAYLTGKKALLRAHFSGVPGIFAYEEIPDPSKMRGFVSSMTGMSESLVELVLKLAGL